MTVRHSMVNDWSLMIKVFNTHQDQYTNTTGEYSTEAGAKDVARGLATWLRCVLPNPIGKSIVVVKGEKGFYIHFPNYLIRWYPASKDLNLFIRELHRVAIEIREIK